MNVRRKALLLVLIVAVFAAACGNKSNSTNANQSSSGTGSSAGPIKIGFISSQAGSGAALGQVELKAADLFVEQTNKAGGVLGRQIELVKGDDQSKPDVAVTEARKIIQQGVVAMVGPTITPTMIAVIPVIKEAKIPAVFMSPADYPNLNKEPLLFSPLTPSVEQGLEGLLPYLKGKGMAKVGLVFGNDALGDAFELATKNVLARNAGIEVEISRVPVDSQDYTSVLASLRDKNVKAIFTGMTGPASATVRKNQVQLGWDVPVFSHTGNISKPFTDLLGSAATGMGWYSTGAPIAADLPDGPQKKLINDVVAGYQAKYNEPPADFLAAGFAYDQLLSVTEAIKKANSTDPAKIRDALETQELVGMNATIKRTATDHRGTLQSSVYLIEWKNSRYTKLG